jgi:hypothetical protein
MIDRRLTDALAAKVMGWKVFPNRFIKADRGWILRRRFQPCVNLQHAHLLLNTADPEEYLVGSTGQGQCCVRVRIAGVTAEARDAIQPRAITLAVARAVGIEFKS